MRPTPRTLVAALVSMLLATGVVAVVEGSAVAAPVAGAQTSGDSLFPDQGNGGYDVSDYDIKLAWATSGSITATTTITAATTGVPLSSFSLDFEGLTVGTVKVDGAAATFTRVDDAKGAGKHKLVVTPASPVDGTFTTVVTYSGTPVAHTDVDDSKEGWNTTPDGAIFLNQPIGSMTGFPNNNTPRDRATYSVSLTVPSVAGTGVSAISNGVLVSRTGGGLTDTTSTWNWRQSRPMASELSLIAIGNFTQYAGSIDLGDGRVVPELSYADSAGAAASGIDAARAALPATLAFIQSEYGAYPGAAAGLLTDVVNVNDIGYALETQDRPFFPITIDAATMTHELTHQWYGDSVSPCDWNDIWLNEGPATFVPVQYDHVKDPTQPTTEDAFFGLWDDTAASDTDWTVPPARMTDPADLFGWQVYNRGAMTLEALRAAIGDPAFKQTMRARLSEYAGRCSTSADFITEAQRFSGLDLTAFFQDWIYDADKPAWPAKWVLGLGSTPATGAAPGSDLTYRLTATPTDSRVPLTDGTVDIDVSELVASATLPATLPAGLARTGPTTLTWTVPPTALGATSALSFTATLKPDAHAGTVHVTSRATSVGATCSTCVATTLVDGQPGPTPTVPGAVTPAPIAPAPAPVVLGAPAVGRVLVGSTPGWPMGTTFAYQWSRNGSPITGATGPVLLLRPADLGATITLSVVGSLLGALATPATSAPTTPVALGRQTRHPATSVRGVPVVGAVLHIRGRHRRFDAGTTLTYCWYADGHRIAGATRRTLPVTASLRGLRLRAKVIAREPGYLTLRRVSRDTRPVV